MIPLEHTWKCMYRHVKKAIIDLENTVFQIYAINKAKNKPVYVGKDIISESMAGYDVAGHLPDYTFLKFNYYFQSGIQDWWQRYLSWYIPIKTRFNSTSLTNQTNLTNNPTQTYSLCLIPLVGFVVSADVFLLFEHNLLNCITNNLTKCLDIFKLLKNIVSRKM